ncbi:hypothetical protein LTS18_010386 [Coniosporium uncinatum]|uniref:Uncharacterized protein n=1 Tax=Coniosporium uncinatum TaxID=93489 RepID=A0ACC3DZG4_9PEZI|nr:hypothetical protein LTS18_010386 [Coniosporium uncinatum]
MGIFNFKPTSTADIEKKQERAAYLKDAQNKACELFREIVRDLLRPGITKKSIKSEIHTLGFERHGVRTNWHKQTVRSSPHTLLPYKENPSECIIQEDDILFVDLGTVFEAWEADFGRTSVFGDDPAKKKLRDTLEPIWDAVKARYVQNPDMTGEQLFDTACEKARKVVSSFGGKHSRHVVGNFPHEP